MNSEIDSNDIQSRSSGEIAADIRETRGRMDATLDELGHRLTPRSLLNSAFEWWESPESNNQGSATARKAVVGLARQARTHPMPALLIGSGIAWLIAETAEHEERHTRPRPGGDYRSISNEDGATSAGHSGEGVLGTVKEKVSALGDKLGESTDQLSRQAHKAMDQGKSVVRKLKDEVKDGYHLGTDRFGKACDDYPLAVGLGFAALGALAGLIIPRTRSEDELMGEQSDEFVKESKEKAGELMESGKAVGNRVLQSVKEEAADMGITPASVAEKISNLTESGTHLVQKAKEEAVQAAKDEGHSLVPKDGALV